MSEMENQQFTPPPPPPQTSVLAIVSLILSLLGFPISCCCILGIALSIAGVICGHLALMRIKASEGALTGRGLAIAGLILGYIGFIFGIALIALNIIMVAKNPQYQSLFKQLFSQVNKGN